MIQIETPIIQHSCEDYDIPKLTSILAEVAGVELHYLQLLPDDNGIVVGAIFRPEEMELAQEKLRQYEH